MLVQNVAARVLETALKTGGDFAEIFLEDTLSSGISMQRSRIENASTQRRYGAGVRVYKGLRSVYAYTNDCSEAGLIRAAEQAAGALGAENAEVSVTLRGSIARNLTPIEILPQDVRGRRKAEILRAADAAARGVSGEISQVTAAISGTDQTVWIANSEGLYVSDRRVHTRFTVEAVASSGNENQVGAQRPGSGRGFEFIEGLDVEELGRRAGKTAVTMLHAEDCPSGQMPVVIENGFGGVIFHEACGHSLEATSVARGNSVFCGKLGQAIAAPCVTAIDDGAIPGEWGTLNIDDEGIPTQRNVLIENGILKSYLIDRFNGRRMGMPSTGSGRRESYAYAPTSRMNNTFICPGNDDDDEIISSTADGLYAKALGGGSVNPVTGEFNFAVLEAYRIRNGQLAEPLRGATLIGKGSEILFNIDRVGKNLSMAEGVCGSMSGSVPASLGQPRIRVSAITVGGRK